MSNAPAMGIIYRYRITLKITHRIRRYNGWVDPQMRSSVSEKLIWAQKALSNRALPYHGFVYSMCDPPRKYFQADFSARGRVQTLRDRCVYLCRRSQRVILPTPRFSLPCDLVGVQKLGSKKSSHGGCAVLHVVR